MCELHRIFTSSEYLMNHGMNPHLMTAWPIKSLYVARTSTLPEHFLSSKIPLPHLMLLLPSLLLPYTHTYICLTLPSLSFSSSFFFWSTPFPLFPWSSFFFFTSSNRCVKVRLLYDFCLIYIYIYIYIYAIYV